MTDRVIEIRLSAPRPNLLQLLAQPEFALIREGRRHRPVPASRPRRAAPKRSMLRARARGQRTDADDRTGREDVLLSCARAPQAIAAFATGKAGPRARRHLCRSAAGPPRQAAARRAAFRPGRRACSAWSRRARGGPLADAAAAAACSAEAIDRDALSRRLASRAWCRARPCSRPGSTGIADPLAARLDRERRRRAPRRAGRPRRRPPVRRRRAAEPRASRFPTARARDILFDRLPPTGARSALTVERAGPGRAADLALDRRGRAFHLARLVRAPASAAASAPVCCPKPTSCWTPRAPRRRRRSAPPCSPKPPHARRRATCSSRSPRRCAGRWSAAASTASRRTASPATR